MWGVPFRSAISEVEFDRLLDAVRMVIEPTFRREGWA
jgi:hypothetical protein